MLKLPLRGFIMVVAAAAILYGCSRNASSPTEPHSFRQAGRAAQIECGEAAYLSALAPVLFVWEDSIETWQANVDLLNAPPAWTDESTVGGFIDDVTPVLQQWRSAINGALGSAVLDTLAAFDASTEKRQDYLAGLSSLLASWEQALESQRGSDFLPSPPAFQRDVTAPVIACISDTTIACADSEGVVVEFEAIAVDDCDPEPTITSEPLSGSVFPVGSTLVTWTAMDSTGNTSTCSFTVNVEAGAPAVITGANATPSVLWPPNHKWVDVGVSLDVESSCGGEPDCEIVSVSSNESDSGSGDTSPDWVITGDHTLKLRAERSGNGGGRVYTITIRCGDDERTVDVRVPHDRGHGQ
jgi:hypothetical protein